MSYQEIKVSRDDAARFYVDQGVIYEVKEYWQVRWGSGFAHFNIATRSGKELYAVAEYPETFVPVDYETAKAVQKEHIKNAEKVRAAMDAVHDRHREYINSLIRD